MSTDTASHPRLLGGAVFLGFLNAQWALFQWAELLLARAGGTPFCSIDETFNCSAVWDSDFAVLVHNSTQVPIAGWGLIWGIAATLLPLLALVDETRLARGLSSALRLVGLAGLGSVAALGTASAMAGTFCIGCIGTYVLVMVWSALAWRSTRSFGFSALGRGAFWAGAVVAVSFLVLLVPGTRTPHPPRKWRLTRRRPSLPPSRQMIPSFLMARPRATSPVTNSSNVSSPASTLKMPRP